MNVEVRQWIRFLSIRYLNVTAQVAPDGPLIRCSDPRSNRCSEVERKKGAANLPFEDFDHSIKLGIPAGSHGKVSFSMTIQYKGNEKPPHWSKVPQESVPAGVVLPFECTPEGDFKLTRKPGTLRATFPNLNLSVELEVYHKREDPPDISLPGVPDAVWKDWMKKVRILKIVVLAKLTMSEKEDDSGTKSVTVKDESAAIPDPIVAGSTGERTAVLGPMTIELEPVEVAPPITLPGGARYHVYFDRNLSELDKVVQSPNEGPKHQGNALATWVRENLNSKWDVIQALTWKKLAVHVEARASATGKGLSHAELLHFNQQLSEKRLDAVKKRLKKTIEEKDKYIVLDETQMKAIGASEAPKFGVEDDFERRCVISIDGDDLKKAINEIYKRDFGGTSMAEFRSRLP
jgi:hypothetical protein